MIGRTPSPPTTSAVVKSLLGTGPASHLQCAEDLQGPCMLGSGLCVAHAACPVRQGLSLLSSARPLSAL